MKPTKAKTRKEYWYLGATALLQQKSIKMRSELELKFARHLDFQMMLEAPTIDSWQYEPFKLDRLPNLLSCGKMSTKLKKDGSPRYTYTPDFVVKPKGFNVTVQGLDVDEKQIEQELNDVLCQKPIIYEVKGWAMNRKQGIDRFESIANLYINEYRFILVEWDSKNKCFTYKEYK